MYIEGYMDVFSCIGFVGGVMIAVWWLLLCVFSYYLEELVYLM